MLRFTTTAAILALTGAFAQPALATDDMSAEAEITCEDFMAMNADDQTMAIDKLKAGREGVREDARGDDGGSTDTDLSENVEKESEAVDGGRDEAQEEGRGGDAMAMATEGCTADSSMTVKDAMDYDR